MAAVGAGALLTGAMANAAETLGEALVKTYNGNPTIMAQRAQLRSLDEGVAVARAAGAVGEVVNLGSDFEVSVGDTARLIAEVMGVSAEIVSDAERLRPDASEVQRLWADTRKAAALLEWQPAYGGLEGFKRGLAETVTWFTQGENLTRYRPDVYNV